MPKMECPNERVGKPKLEGGRKAAARPHPVYLCKVCQSQSASSRVDFTNYVQCTLCTFLHFQFQWKILPQSIIGSPIPRVVALRSSHSQQSELENLTMHESADI